MDHIKRRERSAPSDTVGPAFRSGAVARIAHMPVATLRIWEQRYRAVHPTTAPSGHRRYSPADVQRVLLLRQLTEQGHAIGSIAALDSALLQQMFQQASLASNGKAQGASRGPARSVVPASWLVVGPALAARLQRPAVARHLAHDVRRVAVCDSLSEVARTSAAARTMLLIWHAPELRPGVSPELLAAQEACGAERVAVVYRFAGSAATQALANAGVATLREPADDEALGSWLASIEAGLPDRAVEVPAAAATPSPLLPSTRRQVPPRRYDDAALTAIAGQPSTLACECPRHVAELLMQLSSFEAYSASCINRDSADAQLHSYLQQVAGASRALFEVALERVVRREGRSLPSLR
jgi:DNA-binding transcriptional MerR regulator